MDYTYTFKFVTNDTESRLQELMDAIEDIIPGEIHFDIACMNCGGVKLTDVGGADDQKIPALPKAEPLPFKAGDHLMVDGDKLKGEVVVVACWNAEMIDPKYNRPGQPYPQVEVRSLRTNKLWHFNGADVDEGKLTLLK